MDVLHVSTPLGGWWEGDLLQLASLRRHFHSTHQLSQVLSELEVDAPVVEAQALQPIGAPPVARRQRLLPLRAAGRKALQGGPGVCQEVTEARNH